MSSESSNTFKNPNTMDLVFKARRKNRKCIRLPKQKIESLKLLFQNNPYPKKEDYKIFGEQIGENPAKVENWFKYQRRTYKSTGLIKDFKERKILSKENERILEETFRMSTTPSAEKYRQLASLLNCEIKPIKKWFSYRRRKLSQIQKKKNNKKNLSDFSSNSGNLIKQNEEDYQAMRKTYTENKIRTDSNIVQKKNGDFNLIIKNELAVENSSVFYTSNDSNSGKNAPQKDSNLHSNFNSSNENNSNSNEHNHSCNDSHSNSNEVSNEQKIDRSNQNSHNSQTKTKSTSNLNYKSSDNTNIYINTKQEDEKIEKIDNERKNKRARPQKSNAKPDYPNKKRKLNNLMNSNNNSNHSSNLQKNSDDSYNLNYLLHTISNNNVANQKTLPQSSDTFHSSNINNFDQKKTPELNINYNQPNNNNSSDQNVQNNFVKYSPNIPICYPYQMNQPFNNSVGYLQGNYNYVDNSKNMPNIQNTNNYMPFVVYNNNIDPNSQINYNYMRQNPHIQPNFVLTTQVPQNTSQNNVQFVPNFMIGNSNPMNNYQICQFGLPMRPIQNMVLVTPDQINQMPRNNMNNMVPSYFIYPQMMTNNMNSIGNSSIKEKVKNNEERPN